MIKNTIAVIASIFILSSCTEDKPVVIVEPVQENVNETGTVVPVVKDTVIEKIAEAEPAINYTGKYTLFVTRFKEFTISHSVELVQIQDSIKGFYSITYSNLKKQPIANYQGEVSGKMKQTLDNVNSGSDLVFDITEQKVDSVKFKASKEAAYMIDKFLESKTLTTRFSINKNTIENNYAGGEWDTWTKVK
ncbi:MAG: hypothetical protein ABIP51_20225 [Bacteroidia bacterium]